QLDLSNGKLLSFGKRRSDLLEQIHDGSIIDRRLGWSFFKLLYTTISGLALFLFTVTGFWLWYGPKRMRKQ
ncbi:MAG: PepSY domain-containing protein, partial [Bacteroidota bacterium]